MTNLSDTPKGLPDIEIRDDGSTMERFSSLARRLLSASREDVAKAEEQFKADQKAKQSGAGNDAVRLKLKGSLNHAHDS